MNRILKLLFYVIVLPISVYGQKKTLTHDDYDQWKSIKTYAISADGSLVVYQINPQQGDGNLYIYDTKKNTTTVMPRGHGATISWDANYVVFKVKPLYAEVREAKRKEVKKDKMPKSDVVILNVKTGLTDTIKGAVGFKMPKEHEGWVAIKLSPIAPLKKESGDTLKETEKKEESQVTESPKKAKDKKEKDKNQLLIRTLNGTTTDTINFVDQYLFAKTTPHILYTISHKKTDTIKGVYTYLNGTKELLDSAGAEFTQLTISDDASKMAWIITRDSAKAEVKKYALRVRFGNKTVEVDSSYAGMPINQMPSEFKHPSFSEDGSVLFFEYRKIPVAKVKDTMALKEEKVNLDIWSWTDTTVMPAQLHNLKREKEKGYLAVFHFNNEKLVVLENEDLPYVSYNTKHLTNWLAGRDDRKHKLSSSWDYPIANDLYVVNINTGERKLMVSDVKANGRISPGGKYLYGYSKEPKEWHAIEIETGKKLILNHFKEPVWNVEHDSPALPNAYGIAGWTKNDSSILIYTQYNIWKVDLADVENPIKLTESSLVKEKTRFRYNSLDSDEKFLPNVMLLSAFEEDTKKEGYFNIDLSTKALDLVMPFEDSNYWGISKAKNAETILYRKGNFVNYREIYVAEKLGSKAIKISETNPQQKEYNWGTVELVHWKGKKGVGNLDGLLIKPENFDETKKYPVLIYFYERYSDLLNYHFDFRPSASTINFPYFASNGYVIFVPDIVYKEGHPGKSAYNCVVSGAEWLAKKAWVDENKMAIQGQSWGGYQVAYLVTQTDMFACAMAGAPVSNMTSAYGGIRWGSGWSREFQYEKTQSRIGATLWEERDLYIENSPVFFADKVNTPLLMMHNDNDGAVPWYQGIEYFMALRRLSKPAWMLVYNNEEHNLRKRHNRKDLSVRMAQFFDYYLKGEEQPDWLKEGRKALEK